MKKGKYFLSSASLFIIIIAAILFVISFLNNWNMLFIWEAAILAGIGVVLRVLSIFLRPAKEQNLQDNLNL
jgi:predicted membrane protein